MSFILISSLYRHAVYTSASALLLTLAASTDWPMKTVPEACKHSLAQTYKCTFSHSDSTQLLHMHLPWIVKTCDFFPVQPKNWLLCATLRCTRQQYSANTSFVTVFEKEKQKVNSNENSTVELRIILSRLRGFYCTIASTTRHPFTNSIRNL